MHNTIRSITVVCFFLCAPFIMFGAESMMVLQNWDMNGAGFAQCDKRIAANRTRNLLSRKGVRIVDSAGLSYGGAKMLFDGSAGVLLGEGRVGISGKPAVLTFYLGGPRVIRQVGVFTFNSDTRANQDFEVRFADNSQKPGVKPAFSGKPGLTTGDTVVGNNKGGLHVFFRTPGGGELAPRRADWIQFRFWPTYNTKAGTPAKAATKADSWTSLIELEVLGSADDVIWIPECDIAESEAQLKKALKTVYKKRSTWQETMLSVCEAVEKSTASFSGKKGFTPFVSDILKGNRAPAGISVSVAGLDRISRPPGRAHA